MRNGSLSQLGVSLPEVEHYLISKLSNTNNVNIFKQPSIFYPLGLETDSKYGFWRKRKHSGWWPYLLLPVGNYSKYLKRTKLRLVPTNKFWFHLLLANVIWTKFGVTLLIRPEPGLALAHHISGTWEPQCTVGNQVHYGISTTPPCHCHYFKNCVRQFSKTSWWKSVEKFCHWLRFFHIKFYWL